jgi:hypothetical protein
MRVGMQRASAPTEYGAYSAEGEKKRKDSVLQGIQRSGGNGVHNKEKRERTQ